jgi:hypothetical protein
MCIDSNFRQITSVGLGSVAPIWKVTHDIVPMCHESSPRLASKRYFYNSDFDSFLVFSLKFICPSVNESMLQHIFKVSMLVDIRVKLLEEIDAKGKGTCS